VITGKKQDGNWSHATLTAVILSRIVVGHAFQRRTTAIRRRPAVLITQVVGRKAAASVLGEKEIPDHEKRLNAEALIEQAVGFVNTDAARAAELGRIALALEFPPSAYRLAWALRSKSPELANQFVKAALSNVSTAPAPAKLYVLQRMIFPEHSNASVPANLVPHRELKISFLSFMAEHLRQRQLAFSSKQSRTCSDEAVFTTRLKSSFTELLPEKAPMVNQAIDICLADVKPQTKQLLNQDLQKTDVEEMLKEADRIQHDPAVRGRYLINAALAAMKQKRLAMAIQILEKMNDEEKKVDAEFWEDLRLDAGAALAVAEYKEGDVPRAQKTLKDLPEPLRSLGQITFVVQISPEDITCSQLCTDLLNEARRSIGKSELRFGRKSSYWLLLTKLYSEFNLQTEAAETFREMVVAFNSARTDGNASGNDALAGQLLTDRKESFPVSR
jgi:tetratricopeptide (TPR) repeat protein